MFYGTQNRQLEKNKSNKISVKQTAKTMPTKREINELKFERNPSWNPWAKTQLASTAVRLEMNTRILDILILQDKTLICAFTTILNKMASFGVNIYRPSASEHGQNITIITMNFKNQLCHFIDMYIGKIFWPMAPCRRCPERDLGTGLGRAWFVFWLSKTSFAVVCAAFRCFFL